MKAFYAKLRELGFKRVHRCRSDNDCHIYERDEGDRITIIVQLWPDGRHRASHMAGGRCKDRPSDFRLVSSMTGAVEAQVILAKAERASQGERDE